MTRKNVDTTQREGTLVARMAEKFAVEPATLLQTLKATAFRQSNNAVISNEQMFALLIVADQYHLNPFLKEIYAFSDKQGGIVPVVGVDGWNRIANEHPQFDGVEFVYSEDIAQPDEALSHCHAWIEAVLYRKDRGHPTRVREYLDECYRAPFKDAQTGFTRLGPWQSHPKRLLRHKAEIQCYRIGFGFVGIYDEDEASRIIEAQTEGSQMANVAPIIPAIQPAAVHPSQPSLEAFLQDDVKRQEVDGFLAKLVKRAQSSNQWQAAEELVRDRLSGQAAAYALAQLATARAGDGSAAPKKTASDVSAASDRSPDAAPAPMATAGAGYF